MPKTVYIYCVFDSEAVPKDKYKVTIKTKDKLHSLIVERDIVFIMFGFNKGVGLLQTAMINDVIELPSKSIDDRQHIPIEEFEKTSLIIEKENLPLL